MFVLLGFLIGASFVSAEETNLSSPGILPDSPFYFLKTWKESIQTFFLLGEANKAKQFLHLADIRMAEYQKMLEKGKTEIARKTLEKYEKQLNRAIEKTQKLQKIKKGEDILQDLGKITSKHLELFEENLQKAPDSAPKGIKKILETSRGWKTYTNEKYKYEVQYPPSCKVQKDGEPPFPGPPQGVQFSTKTSVNGYCNISIEAEGYNQFEIDNLKSKNYKEDSIVIDGITALKLTSPEAEGQDFIYLKDADHNFRISRNGIPNEKDRNECLKIFNRMLSTLNF